MSRRVLLILNPTARAGRAAREIAGVRSRLENAGCHVTLRETAGRGHATVVAATAADAGEFEVIAAAGGDGTGACAWLCCWSSSHRLRARRNRS